MNLILNNFQIINNVTWLRWFIIILFLALVFGLAVVNGSIILNLMCYEILYLYINIIFLICGFIFQDLMSHLFILTLLTVIAAESAIVLALLVFHYKLGGSLEI
jgi:NADH:ubiquinone oxidoreductase subunit K